MDGKYQLAGNPVGQGVLVSTAYLALVSILQANICTKKIGMDRQPASSSIPVVRSLTVKDKHEMDVAEWTRSERKKKEKR